MKKLMTILMIFLLTACQKMELIDPVPETGTLKSAKIDNENEILVKFKDQKHGNAYGQVKKQIHGINVIQVADVDKALEKLNNDPDVLWAEPNGKIELDVFPNDSVYGTGTLWNMEADPINQYGVHATEQWAKGNVGSSDVYVAIIDQGYMITHPDLICNVGKNPKEVEGNGIDDDGNGYIDDVYGWDFYNEDNSVFDGSEDYHGTHVAGIIGAKGNNIIGVAGVCWDVKFISAKCLGYYGGFWDDCIAAVYYVIGLKQAGLNIVAANCSWGSSDRSRGLQQAFEDAETAGIIMVCAAGNNGNTRSHFPASYRFGNIISVAAIDNGGHLTPWSCYSKRLVDIGAPGNNIVSTYCCGKFHYTAMSGTSMAAPHVTGACALYKSLHPLATWQETKAAILNNVIETPSLVGKVATGGRLDVSNF